MKTTASRTTVLSALAYVNELYGYQLTLNRDEQKGKYFHFTIKSRKSGIPGSRLSYSGRKLISASWHAHGYLFEQILRLEPDAVIYSLGERYEAGFIWQDKNIGSMMHPVYFSETSIL